VERGGEVLGILECRIQIQVELSRRKEREMVLRKNIFSREQWTGYSRCTGVAGGVYFDS
jgi:hypothetical protein